MRRRRTLRETVEARIAERRDEVFLPREFRDLGGEDQALRVLRGLTREGRLGYGVYGRTEISYLTGKPILAAEGGLLWRWDGIRSRFRERE